MKINKKIIFILVQCFIVHTIQAQTYMIKYSKNTDPFKWTINKIEIDEKSNMSFIYLTVKNESHSNRALNFANGEYIHLNAFNNKIKSTYNSLTKKSLNNLNLKPGEQVSITIEFPGVNILYAKEFDLKIANHFTLKNIKLPNLKLIDIQNQMQTWEQFYSSNSKVKPIFESEDDVRNSIKKEVDNWQKKGEFESTSNWKTRVNDSSRKKFIKETTDYYVNKYNQEIQQIKNDQIERAKEYEKYKENLLNQFYQQKVIIATNKFLSTEFDLMPYDADNETFLITCKNSGDILLPVPVSDAPSFKQNWINIKSNIKPEFVPNGDEVALTKIIFKNKDKEFIYDIHTQANYAITDVKYNFTPLEFKELDLADVNIVDVSVTTQNVDSKILGKTSPDVLVIQNAQISKRNINASEKSDLDIAIPQNKIDKKSTTFAVIIANENYNSVSNVPYALKDGEVLEKYLTQTVGLPKDHVKIYTNASFGNIAAALKHIENLSEAFGKDINLIFYYAGHGMPNEKTKNPMLIPVDGDVVIPETCFDLDKIISKLGELDANSVIVLLDACFSGTERGDGMLMASRGIRIKSNKTEPVGNMVILSASQGDETAFPYETEQHGLFTFFLLKKLQENKGDVKLGELSDYIAEQVKRQSVVTNGKLQTPSISISSQMNDIWRELKFGK